MTSLYVHVGHGKTGSSFIQSTFANSVDELRKNKIVYPANETILKAAKGGISSGNGSVLLNQLQILSKCKIQADESILISGEILFNKLLSKDTIKNTNHILEKYNISEINCLLFIRNPIEHAASFYQQLIKREGYTSSIESFLKTYKTPQVVSSLLDQISKRIGYTIDVRNYSNIKKNINQEVADWLNIPTSVLKPPGNSTVNRSLTLGELEAQRFLNQHLGKSGNLLSDRLCEELPDIRSEKLLPDQEAQRELLDRLGPYIESVNKKTQPNHQYKKDLLTPSANKTESTYKFTSEQLRIIIGGLGKAILRLKSKN